MVYAAAFPWQKQAAWHKALCGPARLGARISAGKSQLCNRPRAALQDVPGGGRCPERTGLDQKRSEVACGYAPSLRHRERRPLQNIKPQIAASRTPFSPALHLTMRRACAAEFQARSPASGSPQHWAAGGSAGPAPGAQHTAGKPSPRWPRTRTAGALRRRCRLARRQGSPARRQRGCPGGAGRWPRGATIYSAGSSPGLGRLVLPRLPGVRLASSRRPRVLWGTGAGRSQRFEGRAGKSSRSPVRGQS